MKNNIQKERTKDTPTKISPSLIPNKYIPAKDLVNRMQQPIETKVSP